MIKRLSVLGRVSLALGLAAALALSIPVSAVYDGRVDASTDGALIMRGNNVVNDEEYVDDDNIDTPDDDGIDTPTPTDDDGTDNDGIDTPTPTDDDGTDNDRTDDGTDSD